MVIDLSLPIKNDMYIFPGDPRPNIHQVQNIDEHGWNMLRLEMNLHDGTHVNLPLHGVKDGKSLNEYRISRFFGPATTYGLNLDIVPSKGVIFCNTNISMALAQLIGKVQPLFVGLASEYEIDLDVEKYLLGHNVILYEQLANTAKLPKNFMFYGIPLNILDADGSPIRAFAVTD